MLRGVPIRARNELAARLGPIDWVLLATLVVLPLAFMWHFASPSYFFWDDLGLMYWAHNSDLSLSYLLAPSWGYLTPGRSLTYLALDRIAPMNFEVALAVLLACHAVSAVLLQRILTLLFGRAWWSYALALVWASSFVYVQGFSWFAAGLHSIPAITATLASIHAYLCWRATGRRGWLAWSLVAMCIGLAFYVKALLIPFYLLLMRVLLLDPSARLRDSLRSVRGEWRVWLIYMTVGVVYVLAYARGDYWHPPIDTTPGEVLHYLGVLWVEGLSPAVLAVRAPNYEESAWHGIVILGAQVGVIGLVAWSIVRRRVAWRAWAFLAVAYLTNALMVVGRLAEYDAETIGHTLRYYTELALLVPLAVAFALAAPRLRARVAPVRPPPTVSPAASPGDRRTGAGCPGLRLPTARAAAAALVGLTAYLALTWATANSFSNPAGTESTGEQVENQFGRFTRQYFDNLRSDLAGVRRTGEDFVLLDQDVPEGVMGGYVNLDPQALREGVRYTSLSSILPLFGEQVSFNRPGRLHLVSSDGHLQRTRFVPAAGGSLEELRQEGRLRLEGARIERGRGKNRCVVANGPSSLEWEPRPHLHGRDWWLRARYRTDPVRPFLLETNAGGGWIYEGEKFPPMGFLGTAIIGLAEQDEGVPTNAGIRVGIPPSGRLCLRSLEIGHFDPPPPP